MKSDENIICEQVDFDGSIDSFRKNRMAYFSVKDILEPKREPYVAFFVKIEMLILR